MLTQKLACKRLRAIGLGPRETRAILEQVDGWFKSSGAEWTVSRLKKFKANLLLSVSGNGGCDWSWICTRHGLPVGPFHNLFKRGMQGNLKRGNRGFVQALNALMIYSSMVTKRVTRAQWKKFQSSVEQGGIDKDGTPLARYSSDSCVVKDDPVPKWKHIRFRVPEAVCVPEWRDKQSENLAIASGSTPVSYRVLDTSTVLTETGYDALPTILWNHRRNVYEPKSQAIRKEIFFSPWEEWDIPTDIMIQDTVHDWSVSPEKRAPAGYRSVKQSAMREQLDLFLASRDNRKIYKEYREIYESVLRPLFESGYKLPVFESPLTGILGVGKVGLIQEPGYKLRAVFNPHHLHQLALEPLKRALLYVLGTKLRGYDFTHNQEAAFPKIQGWLKSGRTVHSVDLSDATNNFPLEVTMHALSGQSRLRPYLDLFHHISRSGWLVKDPFLSGSFGTQDVKKSKDPTIGLRRMRMSRGQPMGLGPSFMAFALSHHWLVQRIRENIGSKDSDYCILGDDIVIAGDDLYESYMQELGNLHCPVSKQKCLNSTIMAEFAGKVILAEDVVGQWKWREPSDRSFLTVMKNLGYQSLSSSLFSQRQLKVGKLLAEVPESIGGLGFNPKGLSYRDRLELPAAKCLLEQILEQMDLSPDMRFIDSQRNLSWTLTGLTSDFHSEARSYEGMTLTGFVEPKATRKVAVLSVHNAGFGNPSRTTGFSPISKSSKPSPDQGDVERQKSDYERMVETIRPIKEVASDRKVLPDGYAPMVRESDPRGKTTLEVIEGKLNAHSLLTKVIKAAHDRNAEQTSDMDQER